MNAVPTLHDIHDMLATVILIVQSQLIGVRFHMANGAASTPTWTTGFAIIGTNVTSNNGEEMGKMIKKIKLTFSEPILGTASANPELHEEFIASKSADKEKAKEEMSNLHTEELLEKSVTVFPQTPDGTPFLYDYQVKGFLKEAIGMQVEFGSIQLQKVPSVKLSKFTHKRIVDNFVFVFPRVIPLILPDDKGISTCTRPLRAETMKGERVALATSEEAPAGTVLECEIRWLNPKLEEIVTNALNYGELKGLGQWRNSGKGRFSWEEVA
ncbi:MAG: hypothetical protein GY832_47325 [Chloroflexi bacterium]|nr:hypothetical protein [Chloroflexota bacterium]